jgi:hypothetical protein
VTLAAGLEADLVDFVDFVDFVDLADVVLAFFVFFFVTRNDGFELLLELSDISISYS